MIAELPSPITTRFTRRIATIADVEALEQSPYDDLVPARNLYQLFESTARLHPQRAAITVLTPDISGNGEVSLTHRELLGAISKAANLFRSLGVRRDSGTVAILCPILPQIPAALLGAQIAGVASSINYLLNEDAIADLLTAQGASVLVVPSEKEDPAVWNKANNIIGRVGSLRKILVVGEGGENFNDRFGSFDAAISGQPDRLDFDPGADRSSVCALFHTGGTTGRPKLVRLTHGNQIHAAWSFAQVHGLDESDVIINGFPLFHVGGTLTAGLSVLAAGGHVVFPSPYGLRSKEIIQDYWRIVERFRATIVSGVPTSIAALAEVPIGSRNLGSIRMALTGGAVLPKAVGDRFQTRTGIKLFETYGMTETAAAIAFNPGRGEPLQGSVGFRAPFARTRIVAISGDGQQECAPLESGLVLVQGPQVFPGYVDPRHDQGVLTSDHWLITGDIGYLTPDERLVLTGREKDLIVRSGHNIDPAAIEDVANAFPGVQMSSAVGMPDAYAGEVPILFVVSSPDHVIDVRQLQEYIERNINEPPAKPKRVVVLESLPVTAVGKIFKPALRDLAVREKVRSEIDRIFGAASNADIRIDKDDKLNTLVRISVFSDDAVRIQELAVSLSSLPQIYLIEKGSCGAAEGPTGSVQMDRSG